MPEPHPADPPPEPGTYRVYLPDGTHCAASWTGKLWWAHGQQIHPTHYEELGGVTLGSIKGPKG